jgi:hypothetical protein
MCEHDVFASRISCFACHDTVSYYDTILTSLFINYHGISNFYLCGMHDTSYDTFIVTSLRMEVVVDSTMESHNNMKSLCSTGRNLHQDMENGSKLSIPGRLCQAGSLRTYICQGVSVVW